MHVDRVTVIFFAGLVVAIILHEISHGVVAFALGDDTAKRAGRLTLNPVPHVDPFGSIFLPVVGALTHVPVIGWAKPVPVTTRYLRQPRRDYMLIAAAGPASNLLMALAASLVGLILPVSPQALGEPNVTAPLAAILGQLLRLNVLLAVFNMIPIPPLDGGNVLAALLPSSLALSFNRLRPYGFILLYALILTGGFEHIVVPPYQFIVSWLPTK